MAVSSDRKSWVQIYFSLLPIILFVFAWLAVLHMYSPCALLASMQKNAKSFFLMTVTPPFLCIAILSLLPCFAFLIVVSSLCARSSDYFMTLPSMPLTILLSCRHACFDKSRGENQVDALRRSRLPSTERSRASCQSTEGLVGGKARSTALTEAVYDWRGGYTLRDPLAGCRCLWSSPDLYSASRRQMLPGTRQWCIQQAVG